MVDLEGSSKQRLPPLAAEVGHVELFIHDSLHTAKNTLFEMEQAASVMSAGGVMLVDDIDSHMGFASFAERHPGYQTIICPDADRNTRKGCSASRSTPRALLATDLADTGGLNGQSGCGKDWLPNYHRRRCIRRTCWILISAQG